MNPHPRYTLQAQLRRTNLAAVYSGTDTLTGQPVYLALLTNTAASYKPVLSALRAELPLLQNADPTLLTALDYNLDAQPCYVMVEPLVGYSLRQLITREGKGLPPAEALAYCSEAARCVEALHGRGMAHGSIHIDSIIVRDGSMVLLTHMASEIFGTDLFVAGADGVQAPQDRLDYAPPEQGARSAPGTTVACDIYSLGILLYHLLAGVTPGAVPDARQPATWVGGPLTPPLNESVADATLRSRLQKFIQIATARDPLRRWPDVSSFIVALEQVTPGVQPGNPPPIKPVLPARLNQQPASILPMSSQFQTNVASLLVTSSGNTYTVASSRTSVGVVKASGFIPDINLNQEDSGLAQYVSQHQADLLYIEGYWYVWPYAGARNPTFLDGQQLAGGTIYPLRDGAELGLPALRVQFRVGTGQKQ